MSRPAAISILANENGQAILFREGGWGKGSFSRLDAAVTPDGIEMSVNGTAAGLAQSSALAALAASSEFFIGELRDGKAVSVREIQIRTHHAGAVPSRTGP